MVVLGIVFAFIVSLIYSVYAIPRKFSKQHPTLYTMWLGIAYLIGSLIFVIVAVYIFGFIEKENIFDFSVHWASIARALVWTMGMVTFNIAIDKIGLFKFNQWKNIQGPIGSILMLTLLVNDVVSDKVIWVILGMIVMLVSATLFTIKQDGDDKKTTKTGILLALFAGVCFGIGAYFNKWVSIQGYIYCQMLYHSFFIVLFAATFYMFQAKRPKDIFKVEKRVFLPAITGLLFMTATILNIFSYRWISGSISFSITQLNVFWTMLIGIVLFKEISFKKHWLRISTGVVLAIEAIILLLFAL